jgi:hypothetical protein
MATQTEFVAATAGTEAVAITDGATKRQYMTPEGGYVNEAGTSGGGGGSKAAIANMSGG